MPICQLCNRDMASAKTISCLPRKGVEYADGEEADALPYHVEALQPYVAIAPDRCRDCNVMFGGTHHPHCCIERCPRCDGQLLSCDCHAVMMFQYAR